MLQPKNDPFFEQLKADVEEGIRDADAGRLIPFEAVREHFRKLTKEHKRKKRLKPQDD